MPVGNPLVQATVAPSGQSIVLLAKDGAGALTNITSLANANEVQSIQITGAPSGNAFTLSFGGQTTAPIPTIAGPPPRYLTWTFPTIIGHSYSLAATWNFQFGGGLANAPASEYEFITYQAGTIVSDLVTSGVASPDHEGSFTDGSLDIVGWGTLTSWFTVTESNVTASVDSMQLRQTATTDGAFWVGGIRVEDVTTSTVTYYYVIEGSPNIILSNDPTRGWFFYNWKSPSPGGLEATYIFGGGLASVYTIDPGETTAAAVLQNALESLSNVGAGNISVVDNSGGVNGGSYVDYTVTFIGALANLPQSVLTCGDAALTIAELTVGGITTPTLTINSGEPMRLLNPLIDENSPNPYVLFPMFQSTAEVQTGIIGSLPFQGYYPNGFHPDYGDDAALSKFFVVGYNSGETAVFSFTLLKPGTYQFSITYLTTDHVAQDGTIFRPYSAVQVLILDGNSDVLATYTVDEIQAPSDYSDQGVGWKILGSLTTTDPLSTLSLVVNTVGLPDRVDGIQPCATIDAVQLTRTSPDNSIVFTDEDDLVLTIKDNWMTTAAGSIPGSVITLGGPTSILPTFVEGPKTMTAGLNLEAVVSYDNFFTHSNLAYNANSWGGNGSIGNVRNSDTYPTAFFATKDGSGNAILPVTQSIQVVSPPTGITTGDPTEGTYTINGGKFIVTWVGDPTCGLLGLTPLDVPKPSNVTDNWAVYEILASEQSAGVSLTFYAETTTPDPTDETGTRYLINLSDLQIYSPDPSDPTGDTIWGLNTETNIWTKPPLFHPWYLYKLQGMQSLRFMGIINTYQNPCAKLADFKPVTHANRYFPFKEFDTVPVATIQAVSGNPYFILSTAAGFIQDILFQVTTSVPHGLFDGCQVNYGGCGTAEYSVASVDTGSLTSIVHVVDDYTIICYSEIPLGGSGIPGNTMTNVLTPVAGSLIFLNYGSAWPIEDMAALVVEVGCTEMWFNMPITMDTSPGGGVYQTATHLLSLLPPGIKVHIECGNECWNSAYATYTWCRLQQSILLGSSTGNAQLWYANACKAIHDQCVSAFTDAGRPDDLIRVVGSQATQTGVTAAIVAQLQTIGAEFEELCIAPYFANWPASYYGTDQYPIFNGMTTAQLCDYFELMSLHGGWDTSQIPIHRPVLDSHGYNDVNIVAYECGFTNFVPVDPVGQPPGNDPNYAIRQNAVMQNPRMYGVCLQFAQQYQDAGLTHCEWFDVGGGTGFNDWGLYVSGNQQRGTGDPSLDTVNVSNPQAKNQVLAEEAGGWHHWATLSTPPKTTNKSAGARNGQIRAIGFPRGMLRTTSHH